MFSGTFWKQRCPTHCAPLWQGLQSSCIVPLVLVALLSAPQGSQAQGWHGGPGTQAIAEYGNPAVYDRTWNDTLPTGLSPEWEGASLAAPEFDQPVHLSGSYTGHAWTSVSYDEPAATPAAFQSQPYASQAYAPQYQYTNPVQATLPPPLAPPDPQRHDDWVILPAGLLYRSYIAGVKESRFASAFLTEKDSGFLWESVLGGRVGLLRYGTPDAVFGEGFQFDMEGAAFARVRPQEPSAPLDAVDFRFGLILTWRQGPWATKYGYYHLSSHVGDEFLIANPGFARLNYVRDSSLVGVSYDLTGDLRVYGEFGYAFNHEDGAEPIEFQYGIEYSPLDCGGFTGAPFGAINGHTRQDFGWATSVNVLTGWQWRGPESKRAFRVGLQFYSGPSLQFSFVDHYERLTGFGLWYDY